MLKENIRMGDLAAFVEGLRCVLDKEPMNKFDEMFDFASRTCGNDYYSIAAMLAGEFARFMRT